MPARHGKDYIEALKRRRPEIWIDGQRVNDPANHPIFRRPVESIAKLYDMQHEAEWSDILTYPSPDTGDRVGTAFLAPRTPADLRKRGAAFKACADATFGTMGRSPDFMNTCLMAFAESPHFFGKHDRRFAENMRRYYVHCRENDLFLTHAIVNPQVDRSKASSEQEDSYAHLREVRETADGLVVRGAKMLATMAPITDELIVYTIPGFRPGDEAYALAFAVPIDAPGLRLICREPIDRGERSPFDHPLSSRFEESDAVCVFEDVLVPWERVFMHGDVEMGNLLHTDTFLRNFNAQQSSARALAKAELLVGIAISLANTVKTDAFLHVQEMLGELLGYLELVKGIIFLAEETAQKTSSGLLCPNLDPYQALRYHFPRFYSRMVEVVQILGAGGLLMSPTERDFATEIAPDIDKYYRGAGVSAKERIRLFKLAWDATGDAFGQRQLQYERYYAGDPVRVAAAHYQQMDKSHLMGIVRRALADTTVPSP